ncbi:MAG: hypothetical protein AAGB19_01150 [Cyanobacteria bacterium P01_F01_bin.3]
MKNPVIRFIAKHPTRLVVQVAIAITLTFLVSLVALSTRLQTQRPGLLFMLVLPAGTVAAIGTDIVLINMGLTAPVRRNRFSTADADFQAAVSEAVTQVLSQLQEQATKDPNVSVETVAELERFTRDRQGQL